MEERRQIVVTPEDTYIEDGAPVFDTTGKQRQMLFTAIISSGVFVTAGKSTPNVMTTHWGAIGRLWNRDIFILPVRKNKCTHALIEKTKCFAVSVPVKDMSAVIADCDRISGYEVNKFEHLNLHPARARKIPAYTISECGLFIECKVICETALNDGLVDPALFKEMYGEKNFHTLYFGQIIDVYEAEEEN